MHYPIPMSVYYLLNVLNFLPIFLLITWQISTQFYSVGINITQSKASEGNIRTKSTHDTHCDFLITLFIFKQSQLILQF